jgi:hypothetical protein
VDQDFSQAPTAEVTTLARKSWTAYVGLCVTILVLGLILIPLFFWFSKTAGVVVGLLIVALLAYRIAELRTFHLYWTDAGVWVYAGVLPWSKGTRGVKWRDIDDATFNQGMLSWLLRSYSIRIGHRFTRSSELLLTGISRGDKVVAAINRQLQDLARSNRLS